MAAALSFSDNYVRTPDGQERLLLQDSKGQKSVGAIEGRAIVFATEKCCAPWAQASGGSAMVTS